MEILKTEVLKYLGHTNQILDNELNSLIDECIVEIKEKSEEQHFLRSFPLAFKPNGVELVGSILTLEGKDITRHLTNSTDAVLFAATLGHNIERTLGHYSRTTQITKTVVLEACATVAIESYCDEIEDIVKREAKKENRSITWRYSPGYGDLPLSMQKDILAVLETQKKIGLTVTQSMLMIPRKSVTAIIGIQSSGSTGRMQK